MASIVFIHGLANKPEANYLFELWKRKLAHGEGIDADGEGVACAMSYWADVLYPAPDTNLADYESAGSEALADATQVQRTETFSAIAADPKARKLAIALGVDPDDLQAEEPTEEEVDAVRHERVPVPAWLRKRLMARFVRDAYLYFHNESFSPRPGETFQVRDELRRRFIDRLRAAEGEGPLVVLSHSMGTIIAYDCLMHEPDCPPIDGLMTVGSPLGLDEVQDFFPAWTRNNGFPSARLNGSWVNIYDPLDAVAGLDPLFANDYQKDGIPVIKDVREDNWGTWRHSISKYLQGRLLRQHLAAMLGVTWP